jgi:hypothetical protein
MAGDFDETMEDFEDRIRQDERSRVLYAVHAELTASFQIHQSREEWVEQMRRRISGA